MPRRPWAALVCATLVVPALSTATPSSSADPSAGATHRETRTSSISGRVTDQRGRPVGGVGVVALNQTGETHLSTDGISTITGSDGRFVARDLAPGTYRVTFLAPGDTYADQVWPHATPGDPGGAVDIDVAAGRAVTGVGAVLPVGGAVTGRTDLTDNDVALLYRRVQGGWDDPEVRRIADGRYLVGGLETGTYRLCVRTPANGSAPTTACLGGADLASAADIRVASGEVSQRDLVIGARGSVAATATQDFVAEDDIDGTATVMRAYRRTPSGYVEVAGAQLDSYGYAAVLLPVGTYRFGFVGADTQVFWPDADALDEADDVLVAADSVRTLAVDLVPGAQIAGRFLDEDGDHQGAVVTAYRRGLDGRWSQVSSYEVAEDGGYRVAGLRPGTYRLGFGADPQWFAATVPVFWPAAPDLAGAGDIVVASLDDRVEGKDVDVDDGSVITGLARPLGRGLTTGGFAIAYRRVGRTWVEERRDRPVSRLDGRFSLAGLPVGTYRVAFVDDQHFYEVGFHGDGGPRRLADAADVVLAADTLVEGIDVNLTAPVRVVERPRVVGRARVGVRLRAQVGTWSPTATRLRLQWYAGTRRVPGATHGTYRVRPRDAGRRITVRVAGTRGSGWRPATARSTPTATVRPR